MKILNAFAGIGGNRELWGCEHEITAVEYDTKIARLYQERFPDDIVLVEDAWQYALNHHDDFDVIWASPPCQSHSRTNDFIYANNLRRYPDLRLYGLIIFLRKWAKVPWLVENVIPYYNPLITPICKRGRHLYWSNVCIPSAPKIGKPEIGSMDVNRKKIKNEQLLNNRVTGAEGKILLDYLLSVKIQTTLTRW